MEETLTISKKENEDLKSEIADLQWQLSDALALIKHLQIEIQLLKNGRKSNTGSTPGSNDYTRSNVKNSRTK